MKDFLNFLKDLTGAIIIFAGAVGLICIFWCFMFEYQKKQHAHEQNLQASQIEHEKQMNSLKKVEEVKGNRKQLIGKVVERIMDIGQKFIGL